MKKIFLLNILLIIVINNSYSQRIAVIKDSGKQVKLNDNGTWEFIYDDPTGSIKLDTVILNKSNESNYLVKCNKLKYGIWINKNKWGYTKSVDDGTSPSEYEFNLIGEDAYGLIIAEKIELPMDNLIEVAIQNAKEAAPDVEVTKRECRIVNGVKVYMLQMEGTIQGVKFVYFCYYYSDENGSIQFMTYTSKKLFPQYRQQMEALLNGFSLVQ
jgi:hypothetical protein